MNPITSTDPLPIQHTFPKFQPLLPTPQISDTPAGLYSLQRWRIHTLVPRALCIHRSSCVYQYGSFEYLIYWLILNCQLVQLKILQQIHIQLPHTGSLGKVQTLVCPSSQHEVPMSFSSHWHGAPYFASLTPVPSVAVFCGVLHFGWSDWGLMTALAPTLTPQAKSAHWS